MKCLLKLSLENYARFVTGIFLTATAVLIAMSVTGCSTLKNLGDVITEKLPEWKQKVEDGINEDPGYDAPAGVMVGILWRNRAAKRYMNSLNYSDERWNSMLSDLKENRCNYIALIIANEKDGENAGYSPHLNGLLDGPVNKPWLERAQKRVAQLKHMGFTVEAFLITDDSPRLARADIIPFARRVEEWFAPDFICPSIEMDEIWSNHVEKGAAVARAVDTPVNGHYLKGSVKSFPGMNHLLYQATSQNERALKSEIQRVIQRTDYPVFCFEISGRGLNGWPEGGKAAIEVGAIGSGVGMTRSQVPTPAGNPYKDFAWDTNQAGNPKNAKVVGKVWDIKLNGTRSASWKDDRPKGWPNVGDKGTDAILYMINYSKNKVQKIEWIYEGQYDRSLKNVGDYKHATPAPRRGDEVSFLLVNIKADEMVIPDWNEREVWP